MRNYAFGEHEIKKRKGAVRLEDLILAATAPTSIGKSRIHKNIVIHLN